jgi:hypothetical protein
LEYSCREGQSNCFTSWQICNYDAAKSVWCKLLTRSLSRAPGCVMHTESVLSSNHNWGSPCPITAGGTCVQSQAGRGNKENNSPRRQSQHCPATLPQHTHTNTHTRTYRAEHFPLRGVKSPKLKPCAGPPAGPRVCTVGYGGFKHAPRDPCRKCRPLQNIAPLDPARRCQQHLPQEADFT